MKFPFRDASRTEHNIKEDVSVSWEYAAIGEMIHQALGESRIIHERDDLKGKISNPDVDKIKTTANEFLDKAFNEYKKERLLRFSFFLISKLFFVLYLTLTCLVFIFAVLFNRMVVFRDVEIVIFSLAILILVIMFLINSAKEMVYKNT